VIKPRRRIGATVLLAALFALAIPMSAATTDGVNFVEGAEAAFDRSVRQAVSGTFG